MGYRTTKRPKPIRRVIQDTSTLSLTKVQNGATAHIAIPCWYKIVNFPEHTHVHDREWHDHIGWPQPGSPDASSQDAYLIKGAPYQYSEDRGGWTHAGRYLDLSQFTPIHLEQEGYENVDVAFANPPEGLEASGYIDDYVVRFTLAPMCEAAIDEDIDVPYTVFVSGTVGNRKARDVVVRGTLRILAGPII